MPISNDIAQAQAKLLGLRAQLKCNNSAASPKESTVQCPRPAASPLINGQRLLSSYRTRDGVCYPEQRSDAVSTDELLQLWSAAKDQLVTSDNGCQVEFSSNVTHYPSLGFAVCRSRQSTSYRVWLLSRHLDTDGRGWIGIKTLRAEWPFSWRRLRQILNDGQDSFWNWNKDQERLWLFGVVQVARQLRVNKLKGRPVLLPVSILFGGIGVFRAHLYASWHSGRNQSPITRTKQEELSGISERTQRHYCRVAGIRRQKNIVVGETFSQTAFQECAWRYGRGAFKFTDRQGKLGRAGESYVAHNMPNTYIGPHRQTAKGRQRKVNRKLKDLVIKRAQGNISETVNRLYYSDGRAAIRAYNRVPYIDAHWPLVVEKGETKLWSIIASRETTA